DELAHIAPSKISPEIFTDVIGNLLRGAPKNYARQMAQRKLIEAKMAQQRDLPRSRDIPLQQRSRDDAMRNAIGISRGGHGRRLPAHVDSDDCGPRDAPVIEERNE